MSRLQQTDGLTEEQQELLKLVRQFVDEQIIPVATELEHKDEYPTQIVEGMKEMGIFGLMIPEEYGRRTIVAASAPGPAAHARRSALERDQLLDRRWHGHHPGPPRTPRPRRHLVDRRAPPGHQPPDRR